jgi:hypothetical protein
MMMAEVRRWAQMQQGLCLEAPEAEMHVTCWLGAATMYVAIK